MYDVICVGSSTIDVFAKTKFSELIKIMDSKGETDLLAYPTGAKILIEELNFTTGGGGTNAAVSLSRLGNKVAYLGKMGNDENSDFVIQSLKQEKVDSLAVCDKKGKTGYSIILDSINHDRTILTYKGSNNNLKFNEISIKKLKTKWFYFSTMLDESYDTLEKLAAFAKKNNIKIAFNASSYLAKKGFIFLKNILSKTDIFVLNKDEAELLTKKKNIKEQLKSINKSGAKIVVITDGKNNFYAFDGNYIYSSKPTKIKVIETTGAGDAFASSFLAGMIKKNNIEFALNLASVNAESVVTHHGAKNKLLKYNEALIRAKKEKICIKKEKI